MDAVVWTAIGLLAATSLGTLFYLGARIDGLRSKMVSVPGSIPRSEDRRARLDSLASPIDAHVDRHAAR